MNEITFCGRVYQKYWHSDDPLADKKASPMTPEERAQSVLHFLDEYLNAHWAQPYDRHRMESARNFLGTALVALVTDARKVDE